MGDDYERQLVSSQQGSCAPWSCVQLSKDRTRCCSGSVISIIDDNRIDFESGTGDIRPFGMLMKRIFVWTVIIAG